MLFAFRAVPFVRASQHLFLSEQAQTVFNWDTTPEEPLAAPFVCRRKVNIFKIRILEGFEISDSRIIEMQGKFKISIEFHHTHDFFHCEVISEVKETVGSLVWFLTVIARDLGRREHAWLYRQVVVNVDRVERVCWIILIWWAFPLEVKLELFLNLLILILLLTISSLKTWHQRSQILKQLNLDPPYSPSPIKYEQSAVCYLLYPLIYVVRSATLEYLYFDQEKIVRPFFGKCDPLIGTYLISTFDEIFDEFFSIDEVTDTFILDSG